MEMTWEREYFRLAGFVLGCKMRANGGTVEGDPFLDQFPDQRERFGCLMGEMDYSAEMRAVLQEARRLRRLRIPIPTPPPGKY